MTDAKLILEKLNLRKNLPKLIFGLVLGGAIYFGVKEISKFQHQIFPTTNVSPSLSQRIQRLNFNDREGNTRLTIWVPRAYLTSFPRNERRGGHQFATFEAEIDSLQPWTTFVSRLHPTDYDTRVEELALKDRHVYVTLKLGSESSGTFQNIASVKRFITELSRYDKQSRYKDTFIRFDSSSKFRTSFYLIPINFGDDSEEVIYFDCSLIGDLNHTRCSAETIFFENVWVQYTILQRDIENWRYWNKQVRKLIAGFLEPNKQTNNSAF